MTPEQAIERVKMLRQYAYGEDAKALDTVLNGIKLPEPKPKKMTKRELVKRLAEIERDKAFTATAKRDAVDLLLRFINDGSVEELVRSI
ncbi:MAG TPA: hypothetical protein VFI14_11170 [Chryseosolibacter sp.]|nr:hypothetical protein [Chryseosolibacter sp.]